MNFTKLKLYHGKCNHIDIATYPDGQHNATLHPDYFNDQKMEIQINCSIRNWEELEILACIVGALKQADYIISDLNYFYLFGLRSDRVFIPGMPNYVRDVLAPYINHISELANVKPWFLAPHGRWKEYIDGHDYLRFGRNFTTFDHYQVIGGDESAELLCEQVNPSQNPMYNEIYPVFKKFRTEHGVTLNLSKEFINFINDNQKPLLVVDDLCDGGATFIQAAELLSVLFPDREKSLFIFHGLFNKGVDILANHYNKIYMTNSYQSIDHPKIQIIEVI